MQNTQKIIRKHSRERKHEHEHKRKRERKRKCKHKRDANPEWVENTCETNTQTQT